MTVDEQARDCRLMTRARALAAWVGAGRPVTAKGVLRRADVGAAAAALGLPAPGWVRTAADLPELHRPWLAASAAGLLTVGVDAAAAGADTPEPATAWLAAVRAVLRAESHDGDRIGATTLCRAVLQAVAEGSTPDPEQLESAVHELLCQLDDDRGWAAYQAFRRGLTAVEAALEVLAEIGAVDPATTTVTPLGQWARGQLAEPVAPGRPPALPSAVEPDQVCQLKIGLDRFRPPVWRRVLVPAGTDLGRLHEIIQIVLAWDDDHLHVFEADGLRFADPWHELEECRPEDEVTLAEVLPRPGTRLRYRYDLGDCWDHTITLERLLTPADAGPTPRCTAGRGDAPVEDWIPEDGPEWIPFDQDLINKRLAASGGARPDEA